MEACRSGEGLPKLARLGPSSAQQTRAKLIIAEMMIVIKVVRLNFGKGIFQSTIVSSRNDLLHAGYVTNRVWAENYRSELLAVR